LPETVQQRRLALNFIAMNGGAAAWPLAARAQQRDRMRRVGVLMSGTATETGRRSNLKTFMDSLAKAGWISGKNIQVEVR
jgi:putative tryptophan/tyrosine transport system substrate-binding protein